MAKHAARRAANGRLAFQPKENHGVLGVGIVSEDRGEGEEDDRDGDKIRANRSQMNVQRVLGQLHAGDLAIDHAGQQDQKRGCRADKDRVDESIRTLAPTPGSKG